MVTTEVPQNCRVIAPRQIGFEITVDGQTRHGVITVEAVVRLFDSDVLDNDEKLLRAVATSSYIAGQVANRVRLGLGGDPRKPIILSTVNFA
jgi:hypothetical protein